MAFCKTELLVALWMILVLPVAGCRGAAGDRTEGSPLKMILAIQATPYSGLIAVADEREFFKRAGLDVTVTVHPSGLDALKAMMRGDAQAATVADIAFASVMEQHASLRVVAAIGASSGSELVARRDRAILKPEDLRGKRIGYSPTTISAYYLYSFLLTHHMSLRDIVAVAIPPSRQAEAVISGEVDAVSAFEVYAFPAKKALGANAVAWDSQNTLSFQWLLAIQDSVTHSPEPGKRLLRALIMAEEFALNQEEETKAILSRKWNFDPEFTGHLWNRTRLFVSLNQSVVIALQSYSKWQMLVSGQTGDPPDVLRHIDTRSLDALDPRLVTVYR